MLPFCFYVATICGALFGWIARGMVEDLRKEKGDAL